MSNFTIQAGVNSINTSWGGVSGSSNIYQVNWGTDDSTSSTSGSLSNIYNYTITGLEPNTNYIVNLNLFDPQWIAAPWQPMAPNTPVTTLPQLTPGAPINLIATSYHNSQSTLSWTAPSDTGDSPIDYYVVKYGTDPTNPSTYNTLSPNPTNSPATVSGLVNGTPCYFQVFAHNASGYQSEPASTSATPSTVPSAPTMLTATSDDNAQSTLTWSVPFTNGGLPITNYLVSIGGQNEISTQSTQTSYTVTGLTNGITYNFRVAAVNANPNAPVFSTSLSATPSTVPSAPTGLTATSNENAQSTLSWSVPSDNGGLSITGYLISGGSITTPISLSAQTSYTVTGLTNGTTYSFQVAATNTNPNSPGPYSAPASAIPSSVPSAPTVLTATSNQNAQATLTWTAPTSDGGLSITDYVVQYKPSNQSEWTTFPHSASSATFTPVSGLTNGITYNFRVAAVNANPNSPGPYSSANATPSTVPDAPINLKAIPGNAQVQLSWSAGPSNYKVE